MNKYHIYMRHLRKQTTRKFKHTKSNKNVNKREKQKHWKQKD